MSKRGKYSWIPSPLLEEVETVKSKERLNSDADALKQIAVFSRRGREAFYDLPISELFKRRRRR